MDALINDSINVLLILIIWVLFLPFVFSIISDRIVLLTIYHELNDKHSFIRGHDLVTIFLFLLSVKNEPNTEETIDRKVVKVAKCYGYLSIPLIYSFTIIINNSVNGVDSNVACFLSLPITLA